MVKTNDETANQIKAEKSDLICGVKESVQELQSRPASLFAVSLSETEKVKISVDKKILP